MALFERIVRALDLRSKDARSTSWLPIFLRLVFLLGRLLITKKMVRGKQTKTRRWGQKSDSQLSVSNFSHSKSQIDDDQSFVQMFSQNVNQGSQEIRRPQRIAIVPYDDSQETNQNEGSTRRQPAVKRAIIQDQSYRQQIVAKKRRYKAGTKALMEIRKYQKSTALLIQHAPFCRVVKDIIYEMSGRQDMRVQSEAVSALQEAAEAFIIQLFEAASLCARHGRRVTVMPADFQLVRNVLNIFTSGGLIT